MTIKSGLQALIQQLLVDVSRHVPAFALEMLAVQVLNEPTNLEMSTIGLRSLRAVVLSPPTYSRAKVLFLQSVSTASNIILHPTKLALCVHRVCRPGGGYYAQ